MTATQVLTAPQDTEPQSPPQAVFERLPVDPFTACDGHASQAIQALVTRLSPKGTLVYLCGNCARKTGFEHTADTPKENRQQGSDHLWSEKSWPWLPCVLCSTSSGCCPSENSLCHIL